MPHLADFRKGWENEHLAASILSKFAFIANPAKIGDDIGIDYFCTFFQRIPKDNKDYLIPSNSFAIQVKSKSNDTLVDVTGHVQYLSHLEIPFFLGIVDQDQPEMCIYSGEYLPIFFSEHGIPTPPETFKLKLWYNHDFDHNHYSYKKPKNAYKLKCPPVACLAVNADDKTFKAETEKVRKLAGQIQRNLLARASGEHFYLVGPKEVPLLMAGSGSVKVFRENFMKRLTVVFWNLDWILGCPKSDFDIDEFRMYEEVYQKLLERNGELPVYLTQRYEGLRNKIEKAGYGT